MKRRSSILFDTCGQRARESPELKQCSQGEVSTQRPESAARLHAQCQRTPNSQCRSVPNWPYPSASH